MREMTRRVPWMGLAVLAAALLPAEAGAVTTWWASADAGGERQVVRSRVVPGAGPQVVVIGDDGEEHVVLAPDGRRGYLGVHLVALTDELRRHFGASEGAGVLVSRVEEGSPAARAGLAVGDVLLAIDGEGVASSWDVKRQVAPHDAGDAVELSVVREGRPLSLSATLEDRPARMLDVGRFVFRSEDGGPGYAFGTGDWGEAEWEELGREMGRLGEEFGRQAGAIVEEVMGDPEIKALVEREMADQRALGQRRRELESRLREVEQRLRELEQRLDDR